MARLSFLNVALVAGMNLAVKAMPQYGPPVFEGYDIDLRPRGLPNPPTYKVVDRLDTRSVLNWTYEESGASWVFIPEDLWESGYHEEAQAMKRDLANLPLAETKDLVARAPHKEGSGKIRDISGKEHKVKWYCEPAAGGVVKFAAAYGIKLACDGVYSVASSSARGQLVWRSPERSDGSLHNRFTFRLMKKMVDGFFTTSCTTVFNAYIFTSGLGCGDKKQLAGTSKVSVRSVGPRSKKDGDEVMLYELSVHK